MNIMDEYARIRAKLDGAITSGLHNQVAEGLKERVKEKAYAKVYSYTPGPDFLRTRRYEWGGLADPNNMIAYVEGTTLTLDNVTGLQNSAQTRLEVPIVESGDGYNQPYPRPFMNEARDEYVDSGKAEHDLIAALESAGFTV